MDQSHNTGPDHQVSLTSVELSARAIPNLESHTTDQHSTKPPRSSDWAVRANCLICAQTAPSSLTQLHPCGHLFCNSCLTDYLEQRVNDNGAGMLGCPAFNCSTKLSDSEIEALVSQITFAKFLRFRMQSELEADPTLRWCPRPGCDGYDRVNGTKQKLTCSACGFSFCRYCLSAWHGGRKCKLEIDRQFERWARSANAKFCPQCRMRVEKNLGCPHMTCSHCSYEWCWACGAAYAGHYRCPVRNPHWANQHWSRCLVLLFLPILFLLCFVIGGNLLFREFLKDQSHSLLSRVSLCVLVTLVTLILSPACFAVALPISGIVFLLFCYKECECCDSCFMKCIAVLLTLPVGLCLSPCVVGVVLCLVMLGPPVGLIAVILKLGVTALRCCKKDLLRVKGTPGYPLG